MGVTGDVEVSKMTKDGSKPGMKSASKMGSGAIGGHQIAVESIKVGRHTLIHANVSRP